MNTKNLLGVLLAGMASCACERSPVASSATDDWEAPTTRAKTVSTLIPPPACVPNLAVAVVPIKGCFIVAKYGLPDCPDAPTWDAPDSMEVRLWQVHPLTPIDGNVGWLAEVRLAGGYKAASPPWVTAQSPQGGEATIYLLFDGAACEEIEGH